MSLLLSCFFLLLLLLLLFFFFFFVFFVVVVCCFLFFCVGFLTHTFTTFLLLLLLQVRSGWVCCGAVAAVFPVDAQRLSDATSRNAQAIGGTAGRPFRRKVGKMLLQLLQDTRVKPKSVCESWARGQRFSGRFFAPI